MIPGIKLITMNYLREVMCLETRWRCVEGEKYPLPLDKRVVGTHK